MSDRGASASVLAEIQKSQIRPFHLFEGVFDGGTVRFCDNTYNITWDSYEWVAAGHLISYDAIEESSDIQATGCSVTLSGMNGEVTAIAIDEDLADKVVKIYRGFFDSSNAIISDPLLIFKGRSEGATFSEDPDNGTSVVNLEVISHFVDYDKVAGRRTNNKEQQRYFPADKFCEFIPNLVNAVIQWE